MRDVGDGTEKGLYFLNHIRDLRTYKGGGSMY